jgi:hypothetical protein
VKGASLPCWRCWLGALDLCGAMGSRMWGTWLCGRGMLTPGHWMMVALRVGGLRSPMRLERSNGAGLWHCLVFGWRSSVAWAARLSTRLACLRGMQRLFWLLRWGQRCYGGAQVVLRMPHDLPETIPDATPVAEATDVVVVAVVCGLETLGVTNGHP